MENLKKVMGFISELQDSEFTNNADLVSVLHYSSVLMGYILLADDLDIEIGCLDYTSILNLVVNSMKITRSRMK